MNPITVVDARMGRGKSSAAIRYMNQQKGQKSFLYITPYLSEVERVCELCDFEEPGSDYACKSAQLKYLLKQKKNVASTHALFTMMDDEALALASKNGYSLIIDESLQVIQGVPVSADDKDMLLNTLMRVDPENGAVRCLEASYDGQFNGYKRMADAGGLYYYAGSLYELMSPNQFTAFDEVYVLTYLFDGQLLKAYFDYHGFEYRVVGVEEDTAGYYFSDRPDAPPPIDYSHLIHIIGEDGDDKMNEIGENRTALSATWFKRRWRNHPDIKKLRGNLRTFFDRRTKSKSDTRFWTTFKDNVDWLLGPNNRYMSNFLPLNTRATNAYRGADCVAYLVNRFVDPNVAKFFAARGVTVDADQFALSEMLQFIWRSAIRDNQEITVYVPSRRMRKLLTDWIEETNRGGTNQ